MTITLNKKEIEKFSKQIILKKIGTLGQKKIKKAKVLIIGIGGLGCPLLTYLSAAGVGTIGIVDHDKVEISNLSRQTIFSTSDVGKFKVSQAKTRIFKLNGNVKINAIRKKVTKKNIKLLLKDYDIICDGTDNFETRYLVNDFCKSSRKILISAAISKFDGHLFKFNFKKKVPCFRCFMPELPSTDYNCETEGIFSPVAGIIGTLQANEVLKTILNLKDDLSDNILIFNSLNMSLRKVKITKNIKCVNKC